MAHTAQDGRVPSLHLKHAELWCLGLWVSDGLGRDELMVGLGLKRLFQPNISMIPFPQTALGMVYLELKESPTSASCSWVPL